MIVHSPNLSLIQIFIGSIYLILISYHFILWMYDAFQGKFIKRFESNALPVVFMIFAMCFLLYSFGIIKGFNQ